MIKKILIVCDDFLPNIGGVSMMMHHLANAFVHNGVDVLVVPPLREGGHSFYQDYYVLNTSRDVWSRVRGDIHFRKNITNEIERVVRDFSADAVLMGDQAYEGIYVEACLNVGENLGLPVGLFCHGYDIQSKMFLKKKWLGANVRNLLSSFCDFKSTKQKAYTGIKHSDVIFTNSNYTASLVSSVANRLSTVTGCGIAMDDYEREVSITPKYSKEKKNTYKEELGLPQKPMVGFVGRLVPSKNVSVLIQSLKECRETEALIIGDGFEIDALKKIAEVTGVSDRVHWLGWVSENEKWHYLRAMDVFCLPSIPLPGEGVEGFGIVSLEASAAGTPVVASRCGGIVDVIEHRKTGLLFDPTDHFDLASKINQLLDDDCLASYCVDNLRNNIEKFYNWPHIAGIIIKQLNDAQNNL